MILPWVKAGITTLAVIFLPIKAMLITTAVLVLADMILGVYAAYKRHEPITSAGFRRSVTKVAVYEVALCLGFLAEKYLLEGAIPVSKFVAGMIGLVETTSIFETLNELSGTNLLKTVITKLGSKNE